jgi:hypothetical protein
LGEQPPQDPALLLQRYACSPGDRSVADNALAGVTASADDDRLTRRDLPAEYPLDRRYRIRA